MELRAGDRIISFTELEPSRELFKAALQVLEGAFRFTTGLANKARNAT